MKCKTNTYISFWISIVGFCWCSWCPSILWKWDLVLVLILLIDFSLHSQSQSATFQVCNIINIIHHLGDIKRIYVELICSKDIWTNQLWFMINVATYRDFQIIDTLSPPLLLTYTIERCKYYHTYAILRVGIVA